MHEADYGARKPLLAAGPGAAAGDRSATSPKRHPSDRLLALFVEGDCSPGTAFLLARHVELCSRCARRVLRSGGSPWSPAEIRQEPWQRLSPGLDVAPLRGVSGLGEAVFLLRAAPGTMMTSGFPLTLGEILLLAGRFDLEGAPHAEGDFAALSGEASARLAADPETGFTAIATVDQSVENGEN